MSETCPACGPIMFADETSCWFCDKCEPTGDETDEREEASHGSEEG